MLLQIENQAFAGDGRASHGRAGHSGLGRACHGCPGDGRASGGDGRAGARIGFKIQGTGSVTKPKLLVFLNVQATLDSECFQMYYKQYSFRKRILNTYLERGF